MAKWVNATITERIIWTSELISFRFKADIEPYKSGQYCTIALEIDGKRVARPFSYVSCSNQDYHEIYIVLVPDGHLSPPLFDLNEGDTFSIMEKSHGFFVLDEVPEAEELWMIATGTGLAPYISILRDTLVWQRFKKIILVHGVRKANELTYGDELSTYQKNNPGVLTVIPFVSREQVDYALEGRIPKALEDGRLEGKAGLTISTEKSHVMLCGNPNMVKDIMEILGTRNLKKNLRRERGHITTEKYWT